MRKAVQHLVPEWILNALLRCAFFALFFLVAWQIAGGRSEEPFRALAALIPWMMGLYGVSEAASLLLVWWDGVREDAPKHEVAVDAAMKMASAERAAALEVAEAQVAELAAALREAADKEAALTAELRAALEAVAAKERAVRESAMREAAARLAAAKEAEAQAPQSPTSLQSALGVLSQDELVVSEIAKRFIESLAPLVQAKPPTHEFVELVRAETAAALEKLRHATQQVEMGSTGEVQSKEQWK